MKPEQRRDMIKRLNQLNDNGGKVVLETAHLEDGTTHASQHPHR